MRSVPEWIGKTDDAMPPARVKDRIRERQDNRCALTGKEFRPGDKIEYDHVTPLWLGGTNTEGNLQAVLHEPHKRKTATEAKVRAKCNRTRKKHLGLDNKAKASGFSKRFKRRMNGDVIDTRTGEVINGRRP
ncbi:Restriction endonuclease [Sinorhizobium sojae CCBAU 05684]|uniref:Restriction endonuclease n=1 Tax=Sinorhizobium sojae CCBAU 05684 TaxID=716928 RepID=A0A249P963_9HYPH|nr:HNH endonuclease signature motif containing protein [Sinorhizobium sojae]ASY62473.1 Restriction endonuclease [Sinorhizobium sojae CCBAU 05684]